MAKTRKKAGSADVIEHDRLMRHALAGFEVDSRQACRALRVCMAVKGFGLGTLLENDLPPDVLAPSAAQRLASHSRSSSGQTDSASQ